MQTNFGPEILATDAGARANEILRSCVHCGFCNATCPTYQLTGDELDGPRGRIYLMQELLERGGNEDRARQHLDRCLTCRACESTCPSGVAYGELVEIARDNLGSKRAGLPGLVRQFLRWVVPGPNRLRIMARLGRGFRWLLPSQLADNLPKKIGQPLLVNSAREVKVLLLNGCAQQVHTAATNEHFNKLLEAHGIGTMTIATEACCGSLDLHLGDTEAALAYARHNVDAFHPLLAEVEAIVSTASGCGVTCKDYGRLLAHDADYADRAAQIAERTVDVSEYLAGKNLDLQRRSEFQAVAWHSPCTLQHGQKVNGLVEGLLSRAGYTLTAVADAHLCCGSAGTYSVLQPAMSEQLRQLKRSALMAGAPDVIASGNVGCQTHLAVGGSVPVLHWIELLN